MKMYSYYRKCIFLKETVLLLKKLYSYWRNCTGIEETEQVLKILYMYWWNCTVIEEIVQVLKKLYSYWRNCTVLEELLKKLLNEKNVFMIEGIRLWSCGWFQICNYNLSWFLRVQLLKKMYSWNWTVYSC